jgi:hypothetical protein
MTVTVLKFGKYKDWAIADVPAHYLAWLIELSEENLRISIRGSPAHRDHHPGVRRVRKAQHRAGNHEMAPMSGLRCAGSSIQGPAIPRCRHARAPGGINKKAEALRSSQGTGGLSRKENMRKIQPTTQLPQLFDHRSDAPANCAACHCSYRDGAGALSVCTAVAR